MSRRTIILFAILMLAVIGAGTVLLLWPGRREAGRSATDAASVREWFCPMHPQVVSDKPGTCPICRMDLVPRERTPSRAESSSQKPGRKVLYWYDPMVPGSRFDRPGKSPFMDMELVPKYADEESASAASTAPVVELSSQAVEASGVGTVRVARLDLSHTVRAVGTITSDEARIERVAARVPGRVERLYANVTGQYVRRGDTLFELYSPDLVATQKEFLLAQNQVQRLEASGSPELSSAHALVDAARDRLRLWGVTTAQIARLEKTQTPNLSLPFPAPVSGTVIRKEVIEGQYVQEGTELYLLADLSRVWLVAQVYEFELGQVRPGTPVTATVSTYPGEAFSGTVDFIEPVLDAQTRTGRVRVGLSNPKGRLRPGMFANAEIRVSLGRQLAVPKAAVIDTGTRQVAYVEVAPGRFEGRQLTLGPTSGEFRVVLTGLSEGERVVAAANFLLDSQAQMAAGSSIQWSGALDVKESSPGERP